MSRRLWNTPVTYQAGEKSGKDKPVQEQIDNLLLLSREASTQARKNALTSWALNIAESARVDVSDVRIRNAATLHFNRIDDYAIKAFRLLAFYEEEDCPIIWHMFKTTWHDYHQIAVNTLYSNSAYTITQELCILSNMRWRLFEDTTVAVVEQPYVPAHEWVEHTFNQYDLKFKMYRME